MTLVNTLQSKLSCGAKLTIKMVDLKRTLMPPLAPVDQLIELMVSNVHPLKNIGQNLQENSKSQQRNPKLIKSYVRYAAGEGT